MTRSPPRARAQAERVGVVLLVAAVLLVPLSFFIPLAHSGLWDPHELQVAELGRRIGVGLFGDDGLRLVGASNLVPVQRELGRGELPFTSIALGFTLFGLEPWAGRLPLALWALVGLVASSGLARRLCNRTAALMTAAALATMPLYFVHAQVMLGFGVAMAGFAVALWGLVELCWPRPERRRWAALGWSIVSALGLVVGAMSEGILLGVAVPTLGVGGSWLLAQPRQQSAWVVPSVVLGLGLVVAVFGAVAAWRAVGADYSALVGLTLRLIPTSTAHDEMWRLLGHALFPWTGLSVLAFSLLVSGVDACEPDSDRPPAGALLMMSVVLAIGVHGALGPYAGHSGFVATPGIAIAIGVAFGGVEDRRIGSRPMAMVFVALTVIVGVDLTRELARTFAPFALGEQTVPESFLRSGRRWVMGAAVLCSLGTYFALQESSRPGRLRLQVREYWVWPRNLRRLGDGDVALVLGVGELCLMGLALTKTISDRGAHWALFENVSGLSVAALRFGWVVLPCALLLVPWAVLLARDAARWLFEAPVGPEARMASRTPSALRSWRGRPRRGEGAVLASALAGACFSLGFYPELMRQSSPAGAFAAYERLAKSSEPLALLGASSEVAPYFVGRDVPSFESSSDAFSWLTAGPERRFLVIEQSELPGLNLAYRQYAPAPANLPVLDSSSSQILLASSGLLPSEHNANPLESVVLAVKPKPARPVSANLNNQLEVLGWEIRDPGGRVETSVAPGTSYVLRLFWRVIARPTQEWTAFVHIDGLGRRFNGDHEMLAGRYPSQYWRPGDYLVDEYPFSLEPNFAPGAYRLYFGLFRGSHRLGVSSGQHHENRVIGGNVEVR